MVMWFKLSAVLFAVNSLSKKSSFYYDVKDMKYDYILLS